MLIRKLRVCIHTFGLKQEGCPPHLFPVLPSENIIYLGKGSSITIPNPESYYGVQYNKDIGCKVPFDPQCCGGCGFMARSFVDAGLTGTNIKIKDLVAFVDSIPRRAEAWKLGGQMARVIKNVMEDAKASYEKGGDGAAHCAAGCNGGFH